MVSEIMKQDPLHEKNLAIVIELEPNEILRRLGISNYNDPEYISCEVLASLIRRRFGMNTGVLNILVKELYARLTKFVNQYVFKNTTWYKVVNSSSEIISETVAYAWERLCADKSSISLAEVRFRHWVQARAIDYLRSLLTQTSLIISDHQDIMKDEDGNEIGLDNFLMHDLEDNPDKVLERYQLSAEIKIVMMSWDRHIRLAVIYRLCDAYDWNTVADLLKVTIPTARKYYQTGIERLMEVNND